MKTIDLRGIESVINDCYMPLIHDMNRYLVLYGGAGSGKSVFCATKILLRTLIEKSKILVIRKVGRTLRNSCFSLIIGLIEKWGLNDFFKVRRSDMHITFNPNQSQILFLGIDDPEKIKSITDITSIWIEEASELNKNDFVQLDLRLRGESEAYKQIIISFNPISATHWLKKHFFDSCVKDCTILKSTYKDNRFIDEEYIKVLENLKTTNPVFFDVYALGNWGVLNGLIYSYEIVEEMPKEYVRYKAYGVDFGFNDPTAVVLVYVTDTEIYAQEILYERGLITSELIDKLNIQYPFLKRERGYFDSAEPDRIKEFQLRGYKVTPAKKSKNSIIDGINEIKRYKLKVLKGSNNLITELENYAWAKDKDDSMLDKPIDDYNHALDALRYVIFTHARPQAPFSYLDPYKEDMPWI